MQGKKIDPKGLEIIVSYLECRWVFFFSPLFPPACLIWLSLLLCAFKEFWKPWKNRSSWIYNIHTIMFTGGMQINTMEIYNSIINYYLLGINHILMQYWSWALHLNCVFTVDFSSSDRQLWPNLFLTHTSMVIAVIPLLLHRPEICWICSSPEPVYPWNLCVCVRVGGGILKVNIDLLIPPFAYYSERPIKNNSLPPWHI